MSFIHKITSIFKPVEKKTSIYKGPSPVNMKNDSEGSHCKPERSGDTASVADLRGTPSQSQVVPGTISTSETGDIHPDHPIHYESFYQPTVHNRCWTIRDFPEMVRNNPKMLKPYKLTFADATPPVEFRLQISRTGIVFLQPIITKDAIQIWGSRYVKYGFSLGPHRILGEDFTLFSPTLQIKHLNKTHLNVLEYKRIIQSYLVEGNLNLIVRFISFSPKTQPVINSVLLGMNNQGEVVQSCSQFSFSKPAELSDNDDNSWIYDDDLRVALETIKQLEETTVPCHRMLNPPVNEESQDESGEDIPVNDYYKQMKSKPLRRSRKSDFLRQKKQLCHIANSISMLYQAPIHANLNQTI